MNKKLTLEERYQIYIEKYSRLEIEKYVDYASLKQIKYSHEWFDAHHIPKCDSASGYSFI